jgi:hypothetical protein
MKFFCKYFEATRKNFKKTYLSVVPAKAGVTMKN